MEVECFGCTKNLGREDPSKIWIWNVAGFEASLCEKCSEIPDHSVIFFDVYHKKDSKKML